MKRNDRPFVIPGLALRELMKRNQAREHASRKATAERVHVARIGSETIESNLPLPPRRAIFLQR
jgi:hypothetical protein